MGSLAGVPPGFTGTVEFRPTFSARPRVGHVLFDFDGTLSLVREGWTEIMTGMFVGSMPRLPGETDADLRDLILDDILRLTGKESIHQLVRLAGRVRERGGEPRDTSWYKDEFLRLLRERIAGRLDALDRGAIRPDDLLVYGARAMLDRLAAAGLTLHLASGTEEAFVRREADLLGIAHYFGGRIHGPRDDTRTFSKKQVIDRILHEYAVTGESLLGFGDGHVEIENTKEVGGLAVAVASDEANNGSGRVDPRKRERLIAAGADVVIPDYRDGPALLDLIQGR